MGELLSSETNWHVLLCSTIIGGLGGGVAYYVTICHRLRNLCCTFLQNLCQSCYCHLHCWIQGVCCGCLQGHLGRLTHRRHWRQIRLHICVCTRPCRRRYSCHWRWCCRCDVDCHRFCLSSGCLFCCWSVNLCWWYKQSMWCQWSWCCGA